MESFIDQHKDYLRSTPSGSSRLWTGKYWKTATRADIFNLARKTIHTIQREADLSLSAAETSALRRWSEIPQSEAKIRFMINMAGKHEDIQIRPGDFEKEKTG